ncbi:MAG: hypothetical protein Q4G33_10765 [bacterium]|nr:hypothetical protein [bacterium]
MKDYSAPVIDIIIFDEEDIMTASGINADYSADQLNRFLFEEEKTNTTTTIMLQKIKISPN